MEPIKVTAVSYLNTKPFLYGLLQEGLTDHLDIQLDIPSVCAARLQNGDARMGLVPVAILPQLPEARIITDYCIGTEGAVKTVGIFSEQPIEQLTHLYLDYHSRTSVQLTKVLLREYWQCSPKLLPARPGFEARIRGTVGALIIGDRTMGLEQQFPYFYDLGVAWRDHTGLPFVFAAWVAIGSLPLGLESRLNRAFNKGINKVDDLALLLQSPSEDFSLSDYYKRYISYRLDAEKRRGLDLFLEKIQSGTATRRSLQVL